MKHEKKQYLNEGRAVGGGPFQYGGFPKVIKEAKYNIPADADEMEKRKNDPSTVGVSKMLEILKGGGHPIMAGQSESGKRGVPPEIRKQAIQHLETIKGHPQGPAQNYSKEHPLYKEGKAAYEFFSTHFPEFGVEDEIVEIYGIGQY
jgi:hypothetical protein